MALTGTLITFWMIVDISIFCHSFSEVGLRTCYWDYTDYWLSALNNSERRTFGQLSSFTIVAYHAKNTLYLVQKECRIININDELKFKTSKWNVSGTARAMQLYSVFSLKCYSWQGFSSLTACIQCNRTLKLAIITGKYIQAHSNLIKMSHYNDFSVMASRSNWSIKHCHQTERVTSITWADVTFWISSDPNYQQTN